MSWDYTELQRFPNTNTSARSYNFSNMVQKPIEIYVFIDPLCPESWSLEPYLKKLSIEFGRYFTLRPIISGHLTSFNRSCFDRPKRFSDIWQRTLKRTGMDCHIDAEHPVKSPWLTALAIKAAELQGKNAGRAFLRKLQEKLFLERENISDESILMYCAKKARLDLDEFKNDLYSETAKKALQCDLKLTNEMKIDYLPAIVFINHLSDEQGIKISGLYPYDIYTLILTKVLQRKPIPSEKPPLEQFIAQHEVITTKEISVVYDWSTTKSEYEMKKLQLKQLVKKADVKQGSFWTYTPNHQP